MVLAKVAHPPTIHSSRLYIGVATYSYTLRPKPARGDFLVDWPVYFVSRRSLTSSRRAEFDASGHPLTGPCQGAITILRNPSVAFTHKSQPPIFLQTLTASVFSLRWLRTESRQSPIRFKHVAMCCDRRGGLGRPRETLVPNRVQGVGHIPVAVAMATPVRNGLTAWAIQSSALQSGGTKTASNH